jgi:predicted 3-demethylubiquinone-9 3-methyltransferase (glyoxalase superfamily)
VSWQIVPSFMDELFSDADSAGAQRAMVAMLAMTKLDSAELRRAYDGAV